MSALSLAACTCTRWDVCPTCIAWNGLIRACDARLAIYRRRPAGVVFDERLRRLERRMRVVEDADLPYRVSELADALGGIDRHEVERNQTVSAP